MQIESITLTSGSHTTPEDGMCVQRFWAKVDKRQNADCWNWLGGFSGPGYGRFAKKSRVLVGAHRFSYELTYGRIPDSLQIDHLCRNPGCVNPLHLEAVAPRVNVLRGKTLAASSAKKTVCSSGHPFDSVNTYNDPRGFRGCKECRRKAKLKYRESGR